jgi:hypothetical protein
MEIDPSKSLNQIGPGSPSKPSNGGDGSAFAAALDKAKSGASGGAEQVGPAGPAGGAASPAELVGVLRHQAVQEENRVQQALDLVTSLSSDFSRGGTPSVADLQAADETLSRLEAQAGQEEGSWLRDARTAVNFYLGRQERESG